MNHFCLSRRKICLPLSAIETTLDKELLLNQNIQINIEISEQYSQLSVLCYNKYIIYTVFL